MVGDVDSRVVAVPSILEERPIRAPIVDVRPLRQQADEEISQGEQPATTIHPE